MQITLIFIKYFRILVSNEMLTSIVQVTYMSLVCYVEYPY